MSRRPLDLTQQTGGFITAGVPLEDPREEDRIRELTEIGKQQGMDETSARKNAEQTRQAETDFDYSVDNRTNALTLIAEAGGDGQAAFPYLTDAQADLLVAFPQLAGAWAQRFPAGRTNTYGQALAQYGFAEREDARRAAEKGDLFARFPSPLKQTQEMAQAATETFNDQGFVRGDNGAIMYRNGVIAVTDPQTGQSQVMFPNNARNVVGSPAWLQQVRNTWDADKVGKWRKRLAKLGYTVEEEGGMAQDLIQGLQAFHQDRYVNHGKVLPVRPGEATGDVRVKDIMVGPAQRRNRIRAVFQQMWGDDPTDAEVERWDGFLMDEARSMLRSGHPVDDIANEAGARVEEALHDDPQAKFFRESEEENTELRDQLLGTFQIMESLGRTR